MKPKTQFEQFTKMNAEQLAKATAEFDAEGIPAGFKKPDAAARARWERAKRKRRKT